MQIRQQCVKVLLTVVRRDQRLLLPLIMCVLNGDPVAPRPHPASGYAAQLLATTSESGGRDSRTAATWRETKSLEQWERGSENRERERERGRGREWGVPVSKRLGEAEWEWGMLGRKPAVRLAHVTSGDGGNILLGSSQCLLWFLLQEPR